jgi:selenide,water dikinase
MKRLLLLGGGHAHVQVLAALAREPLPGVEVLLLTPRRRQMYSGMVPGLVAGRYRAEDCAIALGPLAAAAGARLIEGVAIGLDAAARRVRAAGADAPGDEIDYDILSVDTGPEMDRDAIPGARAHALFVRPIEDFVQRLDALWARAAESRLDIAVVGGGAAGFELVLALRQRLGEASARDGAARLSLVTGGPPPLAAYPPSVVARGRAALAGQGVNAIEDVCLGIEAGKLHLRSGANLPCDVVLLAVGGAAPGWLAGSGLALDARGFIATGPSLQSLSHAEVFAAGDVASRPDAPHPKSGVYAVRAGPPLALNLRRFAAGLPLASYRPQRRTLNLLSLGDGSAIAVWGGWWAQGRWVWRWKDRIDRGFVARYRV